LSRSEIAELTARLEELDRRITQLAGGSAAEVPTLEAAAEEAAEAEAEAPAGDGAKASPETRRKDKRRNAAAKTSRR